MSEFPRVAPLGDAAASLELGDALDVELAARVRGVDRALNDEPFPGLRETLPTQAALLVCYDPGRAGFADVRAMLLERAAASVAPQPGGARHEIPTRYGGEAGPDLAEVAQRCGLGEDDVVALHSGREYTALMLGFLPGFAYLGLLPERLELPRRATPRLRVAAGSVAIAGRQTGIYPAASPGGWNLIGRTAQRLFDPHRDPPSLVLPGDRVRFRPVRELPEPAGAAAPADASREAARLEVLEGGLLTTVQDAGRRGWRRLGVGWAGALDAAAHAAANAAVGNPPQAAALECTLVGPTLRVLAPLRFALAGADLGAVLHRAELGAWPVPPGAGVLARPGNVLAFTGRASGCRASLAFAGGIDVPLVLGSRATDLAAGFGGLAGRPLRPGDRLALGPPRAEAAAPQTRPFAEPALGEATLRVVLGPQAEHFEPESLALFLDARWQISTGSDRIGCRLSGPRLRHRGAAEILSDGMVPGCVEVPPDGQPIVMLADGPTTGGYPKIATVVTADLPRLAQLVPGAARVRFLAISVEEAQRRQG